MQADDGPPPPSKDPTPGFAGKTVGWWVGELAKDDTAPIAVAALAVTGEPASASVARLADDPSPALRGRARAIRARRALWTLLGSLPPDAAATLLRSLDDASQIARARDSTAYADHPIGWWVDQLERSPESSVAALVLRHLGPAGLPVLVRACQDLRRNLREAACHVLVLGATGGWDMTAVLAPLGGMLHHQEPTTRRAATLALTEVGRQEGAPQESALRLLLGAVEVDVRLEALERLKRLPRLERGTLLAVLAALASPEFRVRCAAEEVLTGRDQAPEHPEAALHDILQRIPAEARGDLAILLYRGRPVLPWLTADVLTATATADDGDAPWAFLALSYAAARDPAALEALAGLATTGPAARRIPAFRVLAAMGVDAAPAFRRLAPSWSDPDLDLRTAARAALREMCLVQGPVVEAEGDELARWLGHTDVDGRAMLLEILDSVPAQRLQPHGRLLLENVRPALLEAKARPAALMSAVRWIARLGAADATLADRATALVSEFAAAAREALPSLRRAAAWPDPSTAAAAGRTIRFIEAATGSK